MTEPMPPVFYNVEFHVDIFPEKEWESGLSKGQLIEKMQSALALYPGTDFNFSQPITDNVEEAASGVKDLLPLKFSAKTYMKRRNWLCRSTKYWEPYKVSRIWE